MPTVTSEVNDMAASTAGRGPLSDLIQAVLDEPGMSLRILEDRTTDPATGRPVIAKDAWRKLAHGQRQNVPSKSELEWIARAVRKSDAVVKEAAARQWLGYEALHLSGYDDDMRRILVTLEGMDPRRRREVRAFLDVRAEESSRD